MPLHTTDDPGQRAWDIASHEASQIWRQTGNAKLSEQTISTTYTQALEELAGEEEMITLTTRPLGPTNDCFSSETVVKIIEGQPTSEQQTHMNECEVCQKMVERAKKIKEQLPNDITEIVLAAVDAQIFG